MVDKNSAPGYTIGLSKKTQFATINGLPGPGAYNTIFSLKSQRSLNKLSKQKRFNSYETLAPGPGSYTQNNGQHIAGALVKSRAKPQKLDNIPGPGSYEPDFKKIAKSNSSYKIGSEKRKQDIPKSILTNPGPGNYETSISTLLQSDNKAIKFGPQRKIVLGLDPKTPGPCQYNNTFNQLGLSSMTTQPKYRFGKAQKSKSVYNLSSPGRSIIQYSCTAGTYISKSNFDDAMKSGKGFRMGEKCPKDEDPRKVPGPGAYNTNEIEISKMKKSTPSFSIGKDSKLKIDNLKQYLSKPGPQAYQAKSTVFNHKSFAIGKDTRKGMENMNAVPGPGSYQVKHNQSQPNFSVSRAQRKGLAQKSDTPGPGIYQPKKIYNSQYQGIGLGKDNRRTFVITQKFPGPGEYNQYELNKERGGFTIGHDRRTHDQKNWVPGPGNYNIPSTLSNLPGYSKK